MTFKWKFLTLFMSMIHTSKQSIDGVTYMDDFDFEDRYRNVYECDPLYWHPLHLPDHCTRMYEKLIRSRIACNHPVRIMKEKDENLIYHLYPTYVSPNSHKHKHRHRHQHQYGVQDMPYSGLDLENSPTLVYKTDVVSSWLSPYEKMLDLIRQDVMKQPIAPTIGIIPNLGPVALYRQPISRLSEKAIKKIAGAYKVPETEHERSKDDYEIHMEKDGKDMMKEEKEKLRAHYSIMPHASSTGKKKRPKIRRKKIVKDNLVAIYEKKKIV